MHCLVFTVKFDGGLSIAVLRNEQLFTKNWGFKTQSVYKKLNFPELSNPAIWKKGPHETFYSFLEHPFSCESDRQPYLNSYIKKGVAPIY
jgi:hypothetical protein